MLVPDKKSEYSITVNTIKYNTRLLEDDKFQLMSFSSCKIEVWTVNILNNIPTWTD